MNVIQKLIASAAAKGGETVEAMLKRYEERNPDYAEQLRALWNGGQEDPLSEDPGHGKTSM